MFGRRPRRDDPQRLLADTEHVLAGTYAERLMAGRRTVPAWAWTNLLSHATADELEQAVCSGCDSRNADWAVWLRARAYLAGEVLDAAARHGSLADLQCEVLVPIELALMSEPQEAEPAPSDWVTVVLSAMAGHHRTPRL